MESTAVKSTAVPGFGSSVAILRLVLMAGGKCGGVDLLAVRSGAGEK